uniref:GNAT family N-acetyltransferase n=1 Tax=uncultured Draconibacterium sp. TaxID=1573823 RepID=UPI003216B2CD
MKFREITLQDIPAIFEVRVATDENNFTYEELQESGISFETVEAKLKTTYKGWLCEIENQVTGFIIADKKTAEIWVIAVLPDYINKSIGSQLLKLAEHWLLSCGKEKLWLVTDPDKKLRAYSFYLKNGWKEREIKNGILYMEKDVSLF